MSKFFEDVGTIVPELNELLIRRYTLLKTVLKNQPIGRRALCNEIQYGEGVIRTDIELLKREKLINVKSSGMTLTEAGSEIIDRLALDIKSFTGLTGLEKKIADHFNLRKVHIVIGDCEKDSTVMEEMGKAAAGYLDSEIKSDFIIALTGGSSVKAVVDNFILTKKVSNTMVVPARGGVGRKVELQANTLAADLGNKLNGNYRMLYAPDNLSNEGIELMLKEKETAKTVECIHNSNLIIYGIGKAEKMAQRRGLDEETTNEIIESGAIAEAFGTYFNKDGVEVYKTPIIGIDYQKVSDRDTLLAIAGGESKAQAISAVLGAVSNDILVIDQAAAEAIYNYYI